MGRDLTAWNRGLDDAESGNLAAAGGARDYYDGYDYACPVNGECLASRPACEGEGELARLGGNLPIESASGFTLQLHRLNSYLQAIQAAALVAAARTDGARRATTGAAPRKHAARSANAEGPSAGRSASGQ